MKKIIIEGIDKVLLSKTSKLSDRDREELKNIKKQIQKIDESKKDILIKALKDSGVHLLRFLIDNNDFFT